MPVRRLPIVIAFLASAMLIPACAWRKDIAHALPTVDNNVCKKLRGHVLVYAVFVDSKYTGDWSTHDITSTLDSIRTAMRWVEDQAHTRAIPLTIDVACHQRDGIVPVAADLQRKTVGPTLLGGNGIRNIDRWADKAAKQAAAAFGPDTARITRSKIVPRDTDRLIARIRDQYKVDDVALLFFVDNYFREDVSVVLHAGETEHVEYGVVSYKRPAIIAHEFLHLFGALDLYITPFDRRNAAQRRKVYAMREFPDEVMAFAYRSLDSLRVLPLSEYLIGWRNDLDPGYLKLITGKRLKVVKY